MASLPVSPLPAEGTHPSGSQGNRNASDIANKDVAGVTTSPAQIFPTDKPPTLQGKNQTEKVHADLPSSAPPLQNVTMTPVPTPSPDFKKGAASNNGTSQNGIPVPQQKMSSASTAGLQTTVTPGKSTVPPPSKDDSQSHVHSVEPNISNIATTASLFDRLVFKNENVTSSSSLPPTSSSLQPKSSTTSTPVKTMSTASLSTLKFRPEVVTSQVEQRTATSKETSTDKIDNREDSSMVPDRALDTSPTTQAIQTSASNKDIKNDLTLPQLTRTTKRPSSVGSVLVRSKTNILLSSTKSLLEAATSPKVPPSTTPKVGSSATNRNYTKGEDTASPNNREMHIPLEKSKLLML